MTEFGRILGITIGEFFKGLFWGSGFAVGVYIIISLTGLGAG